MTNLAPHSFETVPSNEAAQIREIADLMVQLLQRRYQKNVSVRRGVHPKDHGCVRAIFQVNDDLPTDLRVGVFATPGKKYDAWIRFSNAAAIIGPDLIPNASETQRNGSRGMAIKLMGVDGKVLIEHQGANTQDFLMINSPAFTFANVADYLILTKALLDHNDDSVKSIGAFAQQVGADAKGKERVKRTLGLVAQIQAQALASPLEGRYFSAAPFLFGNAQVMRYSTQPSGSSVSSMPSQPSDTYLREALIKHLSEKEATFDFQLQTPPNSAEDWAIEDATAEWKSTSFKSVARITIPIQELDTGASRTICEELFFTPWHCLEEHRPLGGINRLRNEVYFASSHHRHHPKEPSGREWFR
jgi:hypothetical protein